jgi:integrase/recombinase XerC
VANFATDPVHMENQPRGVPAAFDVERQRAADDGCGGGVRADVWRTSALHSGSVASRANHLVPEVDPNGQLALFDIPECDTVDWIDPEQRRNGVRGGDAAEPTGTGNALSHAAADHAVLGALEQALAGAREAGDDRPALVVLATCLGDLGRPSALALADRVTLRQARDEWLRRLDAQQKSESTLVGYRVAIDDLLDWSDAHGRNVLEESGIVDYLRSYRERASPAESTYYRRFVLLRSFLRWVSRRHGLQDPFCDLEAPPKPRQESDWLTPDEFRRLIDAAGRPERNLPGLAERDQLVLLTLVLTGLRRSELCALDWRDLELDGRKPSLLVRSGKGGKSRRQPIPASLARQLQRLAKAHSPGPADPVFCGLQGGRLQQTILADIIGRAAKRAGLEKHVTAHTLRHTAATWLRQELGDTRLVAEYLGHADLSTVARYAHVDREELFEAAGRLEALAVPGDEPRAPPNVELSPDTTQSDQLPASDETSTEPDRRHRRGRRPHGRHRR